MLTGCAQQRLEPEPDDGLEHVDVALLDELFVAPGVSLANYRQVMFDPVEVTFEEGWRRRHPDIDHRQFETLRQRLADRLIEILQEEFARGGYMVAESPAPHVLRIRASIENADFPAPETYSDKKTLVYSDGHMTLRVLGFDSPSGALVVRARDYEEDPISQVLERADRVTTFATAQRIFEEWAQEIRSALDVAKVRAGARTPQQ
jgi:hypothetical protein